MKNRKPIILGVLAAVVLCCLAIFHPFLHYQYVAQADTIEKWESFIRRFPEGSYANSAKERLRVLKEDSVWAAAKASNFPSNIKGYLLTYRDGKYVSEANDILSKLARRDWDALPKPYSKPLIDEFLGKWPDYSRSDIEEAVWADLERHRDISRVKAYLDIFPAGRHTVDARALYEKLGTEYWKRVAATRSEELIQSFANEYPDNPVAALASDEISRLYDDLAWVESKGTIKAFERFLVQNPNSPKRGYAEKRIIDLEVQGIAGSDHGKLPAAEPISRNNQSRITEVEIKNSTPHVLTVRYSGTIESRRVSIQPGSTEKIEIASGSYKVAASVEAARVRNYYGEEVLQGGGYSSEFYIQSERSPFGSIPIAPIRPFNYK